MLGISRRSSRALGFVIDTTKSMSDDIEAVRNAASAILDSEVGTENEPSVYILVPFNDPGVTLGRRQTRGAILTWWMLSCLFVSHRVWTAAEDHRPRGL